MTADILIFLLLEQCFKLRNSLFELAFLLIDLTKISFVFFPFLAIKGKPIGQFEIFLRCDVHFPNRKDKYFQSTLILNHDRGY